MLVSSNFLQSVTPCVWVHAVNSLEKLHAAAKQILAATEDCPIGLEIDVRMPMHDTRLMTKTATALVPVLHHDPLLTEGDVVGCVTLAAWLEELSRIVQGISKRIGVVKLDFKDTSAAAMTQELLAASSTLWEILFACFAFWWNADTVVAGSEDATAEFRTDAMSFISFSTTEICALIHAAVHQLGMSLSFGWKLPALFCAYTRKDISKMMEFIRLLATHGVGDDENDNSSNNSCGNDNANCTGNVGNFSVAWQVPPACVTFAVRYSAVFGAYCDEEQEIVCQQLDDLLGYARSLFTVAGNTPPCFLSFWRGRNEQITVDQVAAARRRFPTSTIDVD